MRKAIILAIIGLMLAAATAYGKDLQPTGDRHYVETGNGRQQDLGGRSGNKSDKGLDRAAERSPAVEQGKGGSSGGGLEEVNPKK